MRFSLNAAIVSSTILMPLLASAKANINIRAMRLPVHSDTHRLEIHDVNNGAKGSTQLSFVWIDKEGFKLDHTVPDVGDRNFGAGIGEFKYFNNAGKETQCHLEGGFKDIDNDPDVSWDFHDSGDTAFGPCMEEQGGIKLKCDSQQQCEKGSGAE